MVFQSQLFRSESSEYAAVTSPAEKFLCLAVGLVLIAWCLLPWVSHDTYEAWAQDPIQLWLYGMPVSAAPWYLHVDYHFHFLTSLACGFWLLWARRLWMRVVVWWLPLVALVVAVSIDECFQLWSSSRIAEWQDLAHDWAGALLCAGLYRLARHRPANI